MRRSRVVGGLLSVTAALSTLTAPLFGQGDYLPIFTGAIDITGYQLVLSATAPDRDSGSQTTYPVATLLGPKMNSLLSSPLSSQFDTAWSSLPTDKGITPQVDACIRLEAKLRKQVNIKDVDCNLASEGKLYYEPGKYVFAIGYSLTGNKFRFKLDQFGAPGYEATFSIMMPVNVDTMGICSLRASMLTAQISDMVIHPTNFAGAVATVLADFFNPSKSSEVQQAVHDASLNTTMSIDQAFAEIRDGACSGKSSLDLARALELFGGIDVSLVRGKKMLFAVSYPQITPPTLDVPDAKRRVPGPPSLIPPVISTNKPSTVLGGSMQVYGRYFPPNPDFATQLPITISHAGVNSRLGTCYGGATELSWGLKTGKATTQKLKGDESAPCVAHYTLAGLTPGSTYIFSARDCDFITCSAWSSTVTSTTDSGNSGQRFSSLGGESPVTRFGNVTLNLDGTDFLTNVSLDANGEFIAPVTIPNSVTPWLHQVRAYHQFKLLATSIINVSATNQSSSPQIMVVGVLKGEENMNGDEQMSCPFHPINSTVTDSDFMLFGMGFGTGWISIRLDSPTGPYMGQPIVHLNSDGTFCRQLKSLPASQAGTHTIFVVKRNLVASQTSITFVLPSSP